MSFDFQSALLWIFPVLLAVVLHEVSHGYVASWLGDDTAERMGRLTLNPIPHIDPIGTILLPALLLLSRSPFLFGYAKPVPIGWHNLRNPARDMVYVAAAGPITNLLLALVSAILLGLVAGSAAGGLGSAVDGVHRFSVAVPLAEMAYRSVLINVVLAVFNLLPIPPLDGGRVAVGLLPPALAEPLARIEPYGFALILLLMITNVLGVLIGPPIFALVHLFLGLA